MKVGILGFSKHVHAAPFDDPSWTLWGMNGLHRVEKMDKIPEDRFALWFEPHTPEFLEEYGVKAKIGTQQQDWLAKPHSFPILMQEKYPQWPSSERLPIEKLIKQHGIDYFTSTVAIELAYALSLPDVEEIGLWGIDLVHGTEWGDQRPCAEYWIGRAVERGIKVTIPSVSALLSHQYRYAYENPNPLLAEIRQNLEAYAKETQDKLAELNQQQGATIAGLQTNDGAMQMLRHLNERLDMFERGGRI